MNECKNCIHREVCESWVGSDFYGINRARSCPRYAGEKPMTNAEKLAKDTELLETIIDGYCHDYCGYGKCPKDKIPIPCPRDRSSGSLKEWLEREVEEDG